MKIASIDIGSNTVLLLIAKIELKKKVLIPLKNIYRMPRISKGINESNNISKFAIESLLSVLMEYKNEIEAQNCDKTLVNATQALRIANNSKQIIYDIQKKVGFNVNIISGDREAYLSFLGAQSGFEYKSQVLVIDIGGASTEIIIGLKENISYKKSFPIGVVTLTEKYFGHETSNRTISIVEEHIINIFNELTKINTDNTKIIAVAGTPTTLACAKQNLKQYSDKKVEGYQLTDEDLANFIKKFKQLNPDEILLQYGKIMEGREDIILAGTLILHNILKLLKKDFLYTSGRGLRYGAIIDYINSINKE